MSRANCDLRRLSPALADLLDSCGAVGRVVPGGKHLKLYVGDRMVQTIRRGRASAPSRAGSGRADKNALACVRRALAAMGYVPATEERSPR